MAQFKSYPGKQVRVGRKVVEFDAKGEAETDDKAVIEALGKARNVQKVESRGRPSKATEE